MPLPTHLHKLDGFVHRDVLPIGAAEDGHDVARCRDIDLGLDGRTWKDGVRRRADRQGE